MYYPHKIIRNILPSEFSSVKIRSLLNVFISLNYYKSYQQLNCCLTIQVSVLFGYICKCLQMFNLFCISPKSFQKLSRTLSLAALKLAMSIVKPLDTHNALWESISSFVAVLPTVSLFWCSLVNCTQASTNSAYQWINGMIKDQEEVLAAHELARRWITD